MMIRFLFLIFILLYSSSNAWHFEEHRTIGCMSYWKACKSLKSSFQYLTLAFSKNNSARFKEACGDIVDLPVERACKGVTDEFEWIVPCAGNEKCEEREEKVLQYEFTSQRYGIANAIAGDHTDEVDDFLDEELEDFIRTENIIEYGFLAVNNHAHFHKEAPREWLNFHNKAKEIALQENDFKKAFFYQAFSDHFLQDSFSVGHGGFERRESSPSAAKLYHDFWNERGRFVKNRKGDYWKAFGDSAFLANRKGEFRWKNDDPNEENRIRLLKTAEKSIQDFLESFVFQKANEGKGEDILELFPYDFQKVKNGDEIDYSRPVDIRFLTSNDYFECEKLSRNEKCWDDGTGKVVAISRSIGLVGNYLVIEDENLSGIGLGWYEQSFIPNLGFYLKGGSLAEGEESYFVNPTLMYTVPYLSIFQNLSLEFEIGAYYAHQKSSADDDSASLYSNNSDDEDDEESEAKTYTAPNAMANLLIQFGDVNFRIGAGSVYYEDNHYPLYQMSLSLPLSVRNY